jgi:Uncharacterised nucleotidyltransferase
MIASLQNRNYLHDRHRLSHQQIDSWLGENRSKEFLHEKLKQLEAVKTFLWATDLLRNKGVSFVSLKGPLLSYRIYKDPTVRISHDIDILIEVAAIENTINILVENEYQLMGGYCWPQKQVQQELILGSCHHLSFYNKERSSCIEIHWVLMHGLPVSKKRMKNIIAGNLTEMIFAGRKFTVLNKELEFLFLLIHGSRHGWSRLKWLVDIKDYPASDVDAGIFGKLVWQLNARRIVVQANYFMNKFFHLQLPFSGEDRLPDYFIRFAQCSIDNEIQEEQSTTDLIHTYRYLWLMFPEFNSRCKMVFGALLRPGDISAIDSSFKIMYFLYRPYSFVKRRIMHV